MLNATLEGQELADVERQLAAGADGRAEVARVAEEGHLCAVPMRGVGSSPQPGIARDDDVLLLGGAGVRLVKRTDLLE